MTNTQIIRTERVEACPACGGAGPRTYTGVPDRLYGVAGLWHIARCSACASLWLDPRPTLEDLHLCYPATYFTHREGPAPGPLRPRSGWKDKLRMATLAAGYGYSHLGSPAAISAMGRGIAALPFARQRGPFHLGAFFPSFVPGGRLLDIGCGSGKYLALMRSLGWDVVGIEIDPDAAAIARTRYGLDVWECDVADAAARAPAFDVVTMSHVIEHVADPPAFLRAVAACLRLGGKLHALTPNAASLGHKLFAADWFPLQPPCHLTIFTPLGIRALMGRVDEFSLEHVGTLARTAGKVARERHRVASSGKFKDISVAERLGDRIRVRTFASLESALRTVKPVGEELTIVAGRR